MGTFFTSWALWIQMVFILLGCLAVTILIGWTRNVYNWRKNRRYTKLYGPTGLIQQDIESRNATAVPFGIRALQGGQNVENAWATRPNTPSHALPTSPKYMNPSVNPSINPRSRNPSISSSNKGGISMSSISLSIPRPGRSASDDMSSHFPSPFQLPRSSNYEDHESFDLNIDGTPDQLEHSSSDLLTLEVLEGRGRTWIKPSLEDYGRKRHNSTSGVSFANRSDCWRNPSPSPSSSRSPIPAIIGDGHWRVGTPNSEARSTYTYLSQSNHRLSHVAETGQLGVRRAHAKHADYFLSPYGNYDIAHYPSQNSAPNSSPNLLKPTASSPLPTQEPLTPNSTFFDGPRSSYSTPPTSSQYPPSDPNWPLTSPLSSHYSSDVPSITLDLNKSIRKVKSRSLSELSPSPRFYAPKPVFLKYPTFQTEFPGKELPSLEYELGTSSSSASSMDRDIMSTNVEMKDLVFERTRSHQNSGRIARSMDHTSTIVNSEPIFGNLRHTITDYSKLKENFGVEKINKETIVPFELSPLELPPLAIQNEKNKPRKLQKRRPDSWRETRYTHYRSTSTAMEDARKTNITGL